MSSYNDLTDVSAEAAVIASLIVKPELSFQYDELTPRHFSDQTNSVLYYALCELAKKDAKEIDRINIRSILNSRPSLEKMSRNLTDEDLDSILDFSPEIARTSVEEYKQVAFIVRDKAFRRETLKRLKSCESLCFNNEETDIRTTIYSALDDVIQTFGPSEKLRSMDEIIDDILMEIEEDQKEGNYIPFFIPQLNDYCRIERTQTIVFAALQKRGKSIWLMNNMVSLLKQGMKCLYIDTEISDKEFTMRILAHLSQVEYRKIHDGKLSPEEKERVRSSARWIKTSTKFVHKYIPVVSDAEIMSNVIKMKNTYGVDVVILDYLKANGEYTLDAYKNSAALGRTLDLIKNEIAGRMNLYTLVNVQAAGDFSVAKSKDIGRNCSTLVFLNRKTQEEIYNDGGPRYGNMKLTVLDNRSGSIMSEDEYISLTLDGDFCTFKECEQPERREAY